MSTRKIKISGILTGIEEPDPDPDYEYVIATIVNKEKLRIYKIPIWLADYEYTKTLVGNFVVEVGQKLQLPEVK